MTQIEEVKELIARIEPKTKEIANEIWNYAELSFEETKSSQALISALKEEGFEIEEGIAHIPTAFTAKYVCGSGKPVIGLLAEYDALSSLSQKAAQPVYEPIIQGGSGHGCGHNLLGSACFATAVGLKDYLLGHHMDGTVVLFGCPAEEGAGSKQFIVREGYFDDVDFAYTWHPATRNEVGSTSSVAIMGANFIFDGIAAHAGGSPHLGRSALDACELMDVGANYLREHMIDGARIHYAYSDTGGTAPNVVQSHAVIKYEVRAPKVSQVKELFERLVKVAKGAAMMTETTMHYEITMAFSDYTPSKVLGKIADECMHELGAPVWTEEEYRLAKEFLNSYDPNVLNAIREGLQEDYDEEEINTILERPLDTEIHPFNEHEKKYESGSTDVGDVGYATPTLMLHMATQCIGNVGHTWQNTAFSCSTIGMKGMMCASEVMLLSCIRTLEHPELIEKAKQELHKKNGGHYTCPLPDSVLPPIGKY